MSAQGDATVIAATGTARLEASGGNALVNAQADATVTAGSGTALVEALAGDAALEAPAGDASITGETTTVTASVGTASMTGQGGASITATTEFVVPRSMPMILAMVCVCSSSGVVSFCLSSGFRCQFGRSASADAASPPPATATRAGRSTRSRSR